jgi:hypothetical protein
MELGTAGHDVALQGLDSGIVSLQQIAVSIRTPPSDLLHRVIPCAF